MSVANPELQERELVKLASVAAALAGALRERGVGEPEASVTAEAGVAVFRVSFERWVGEDEPRARGADPRVRRRAAVGQYSTPSAELRNAM